LKQNLLTWSAHVQSWVDDSGLPILVIRYEDLHKNPIYFFSKAISFIGLRGSQKEIKNAIKKASFNRLKQQEEEKGFSEKNTNAASFFRKGIVNNWQNELTKEQVRMIIDAHGDVMERFGYLKDQPTSGKPGRIGKETKL
jgi:aryl sulfotransferase